VPDNAEEKAKEHGALYEKAKLPFVPHAIADGNLVTGQNPGSAKATAKKIVEVLESTASSGPA
jgi:putative intracellular protease/amidase